MPKTLENPKCGASYRRARAQVDYTHSGDEMRSMKNVMDCGLRGFAVGIVSFGLISCGGKEMQRRRQNKRARPSPA